MKKRDICLIAILLVISAAGLIAVNLNKDNGKAYIYTGGKLYGTYDLNTDRQIQIVSDNGIVNDIEISDGTIYMKDATCPNRICVRSGHISRNNESICCAPAGLLIIIRSGGASEYDAITK